MAEFVMKDLVRKAGREHDFYIDNGHLFSPYTLVGRIFRMNGVVSLPKKFFPFLSEKNHFS